MANDKQYIIVIADSAVDLAKDVNSAIAKGWIPLGGATPYISGNGIRWTQTLVRQLHPTV